MSSCATAAHRVRRSAGRRLRIEARIRTRRAAVGQRSRLAHLAGQLVHFVRLHFAHVHRLAGGQKLLEKLFDGQLFVHQLLDDRLGGVLRFGSGRLQ